MKQSVSHKLPNGLLGGRYVMSPEDRGSSFWEASDSMLPVVNVGKARVRRKVSYGNKTVVYEKRLTGQPRADPLPLESVAPTIKHHTF
ncbi:MAG: hypothetical protein IPL15_23130 [Comamonadaceae bacterium]|uniref:hypothetical protein n=1 Tax=Candidatus Skiveiella danica TaxID=3386177 RepID=UPI003908F3E4|nr:hypothetical protein [Comamonadaceae bacterium]